MRVCAILLSNLRVFASNLGLAFGNLTCFEEPSIQSFPRDNMADFSLTLTNII